MAVNSSATQAIIEACRRIKLGHPTWNDTVLIMGFIGGLMTQSGAGDLAVNLMVAVFENTKERMDAEKQFKEMMTELHERTPCIVMPH